MKFESIKVAKDWIYTVDMEHMVGLTVFTAGLLPILGATVFLICFIFEWILLMTQTVFGQKTVYVEKDPLK